MVTKKTERILISISVPHIRDFIQPKHTVVVMRRGTFGAQRIKTVPTPLILFGKNTPSPVHGMSMKRSRVSLIVKPESPLLPRLRNQLGLLETAM
jgi:hypothetical protein